MRRGETVVAMIYIPGPENGVMGIPRADHMSVTGKELREPWSFNIWFSPETIVTAH